jgi:hypothetical protein
MIIRGEQRLEKSTGWLKIIGAITVMRRKFNAEDSQILVATLKNLVALAT